MGRAQNWHLIHFHAKFLPPPASANGHRVCCASCLQILVDKLKFSVLSTVVSSQRQTETDRDTAQRHSTETQHTDTAKRHSTQTQHRDTAHKHSKETQHTDTAKRHSTAHRHSTETQHRDTAQTQTHSAETQRSTDTEHSTGSAAYSGVKALSTAQSTAQRTAQDSTGQHSTSPANTQHKERACVSLGPDCVCVCARVCLHLPSCVCVCLNPGLHLRHRQRGDSNP